MNKHFKRDAYPLIEIAASNPREMGRQYGFQAQKWIGICIDFYRNNFSSKANWSSVTAFGMKYAEIIEKMAPSSYQMLQGISDGSGCRFEDIIAINCRYEIGKFSKLPECTTGVVLSESSSDSHTYVMKNWDNHEELEKHVVIVQIRTDQGLSCMAITEAGQLLRDGFNSAGIAIVSNGMKSIYDRPGLGVPANVIRNEVLLCSDGRQAKTLLNNKDRIASNNTIFYSTITGAVSVEAYPGGIDTVLPQNGILCHANHFVVNPSIDCYQYPKNRDQRLYELLMCHNGNITLEDIEESLRDHMYYPLSLCGHRDPEGDDYVKHRTTIASIIMDMEAQTMWVTKGNPCESEYIPYHM